MLILTPLFLSADSRGLEIQSTVATHWGDSVTPYWQQLHTVISTYMSITKDLS
jgi:hypothetical protein